MGTSLLPYPNPKQGVERWLKPQLSAFTTAHRMRVACQAALRLERHKTKLEARELFRSAPNSTTRWVSWRLVDIGEPIRFFYAGHWAHGVQTEPVIGSSAPARKRRTTVLLFSAKQHNALREAGACRDLRPGFTLDREGSGATVCGLLQALPAMAQMGPSGRAGLRRAMGPVWARHVAGGHQWLAVRAEP